MSTTPLNPADVFSAHRGLIFRTAYRVVGNPADAEEVVSDVGLILVRKLDQFRGDSSIKTWLVRVTTTAALSYRAKRARRYKVVELSPGVAAPVPRERVETLPQEVGAALAKVFHRYRRVLIRRYLDGATHPELVTEFGGTETRTRNLVKKALRMVRRELAGHRV